MVKDNSLFLEDSDGNEVEFEFLDLLRYEGKDYVVLFPVVEYGKDTGEVVILLVEDIDTVEESYTSVKDEATLHMVFKIFLDRFKDEFNFVDNIASTDEE